MQFIDLKAQYAALKGEIDANIQDVLNSAAFIGGKYVKELETQLAAFTGRKHCITCANGTDALQLAFMALGVGEGDAVFAPDMTFISSTEPAAMFGAVSVFCDITPTPITLTPRALSGRSRRCWRRGSTPLRRWWRWTFSATPATMTPFPPSARSTASLSSRMPPRASVRNITGKKTCSFGRIATTSFFPAKPLGCYGDGGAVFTDDDAINDLIRSLCVHGKGPGGKYDNIRVGMNSRLDNLQAAVLLPKLKALADYEMDARQMVAGRYSAAFAGKFTTPFVAEGCLSVWAQYALLAEDSKQRDRIIARLTEKGIPNMVYYPAPQHALPVFRSGPTCGEAFRNANDYCARTFSCPCNHSFDIAPYLQMLSSHFFSFGGCVNFQYIVRDDILYFIDINLRATRPADSPNGRAGLDIPRLLLELLDGEAISPLGCCGNDGLTMYRYFDEYFEIT